MKVIRHVAAPCGAAIGVGDAVAEHGLDPRDPVVVDYTTIGLKVFMTTTDDYTHVQVFTPKGRPFFCAKLHVQLAWVICPS